MIEKMLLYMIQISNLKKRFLNRLIFESFPTEY